MRPCKLVDGASAFVFARYLVVCFVLDIWALRDPKIIVEKLEQNKKHTVRLRGDMNLHNTSAKFQDLSPKNGMTCTFGLLCGKHVKFA